jgi:hypothetical protein
MLTEIAVDENPLVSPSITAYQVGGPDQMFKLFAEQRDEEMKRRRAEEELARKRKQEEQALAILAKEREKVALQDIELSIDEGNIPEEGLTGSVRVMEETSWLPVDAKDALVPSTIGDIDGAAREETSASQQESFYFKDIEDQANLTNIRSNEASLLLLKKTMYVEQLKKIHPDEPLIWRTYSREGQKVL